MRVITECIVEVTIFLASTAGDEVNGVVHSIQGKRI